MHKIHKFLIHFNPVFNLLLKKTKKTIHLQFQYQLKI